ncbi:MAG: hypothetical protein JWP81_2815 [Ferruginibacter sp.]|nr:hypothetical protein [Ferruginibacter sp.]
MVVFFGDFLENFCDGAFVNDILCTGSLNNC